MPLHFTDLGAILPGWELPIRLTGTPRQPAGGERTLPRDASRPLASDSERGDE